MLSRGKTTLCESHLKLETLVLSGKSMGEQECFSPTRQSDGWNTYGRRLNHFHGPFSSPAEKQSSDKGKGVCIETRPKAWEVVT